MRKNITKYSDGTTLRVWNKRLSIVDKQDKFMLTFLFAKKKENDKPTCEYHHHRGIDVTRLAISKEGLRELYTLLHYEIERQNETT